ncbi:MAG TPA: copper chaperone PCu(A)C [Myxococcota bacterium]|nr:copper chaperone PCu(A)C [Myxococcota bacterium]
MRAAGRALALALALAGPLACGGNERGGEARPAPSAALEIRDARVEPSPSGAGPAGGFLTLVNGSDRPWTLVGASSPAAARVELHRSWIESGVAHMAPLDALPVAPGERVALEPGGAHLMLFGATGLAPGDTVVLRLEFADAPPREVTARVVAAGGEHAGHEGEHAPHAHP